MERMVKNSLVVVGVFVLLGIALFINPQDIYYNYKAEELINRPLKSLLDRTEEKGEEIEIDYLGGGVYSVNTKSNEYIIKRTKDSHSNYSYDFFYEPSYLLENGVSLLDKRLE